MCFTNSFIAFSTPHVQQSATLPSPDLWVAHYSVCSKASATLPLYLVCLLHQYNFRPFILVQNTTNLSTRPSLMNPTSSSSPLSLYEASQTPGVSYCLWLSLTSAALSATLHPHRLLPATSLKTCSSTNTSTIQKHHLDFYNVSFPNISCNCWTVSQAYPALGWALLSRILPQPHLLF